MKSIILTDPTGMILHSRRVPVVWFRSIRYARVVFPKGGYPRIAELYPDLKTAARRAYETDSFALPVIDGRIRMPV